MTPARVAAHSVGRVKGGIAGTTGSIELAVLEASPNAIIAVGEDGLITYANAQVQTTFGLPISELIGQPVERLIPERFHVRHWAHRAGFMKDHGARPMGIGLDLAGRRSDGTEFPVEISLSPVETDDGLVVFATVVDITARKSVETALAESERRFRAVLEASPNAIVAVDGGGVITYANPRVAETFGYEREELLDRKVEELLPERVAERHVHHRTGYVQHPGARPMGIGLDLAGRRKDGTEFPVEISLSPVATSDGPLVFATVVDITARKNLEGELLQAQKMESIGRLTGGIAHDFNNMLSAIGGFADLLQDDLASSHTPDVTELQASVAAIRSAADRATALTGQLLAFSRQQVITPRVIDLRASVLELEPMLRRLIGEQVELVLRLDEKTGSFRGDEGQIGQILVNLVVNARDAVADGGRVTIETEKTDFEETDALEHLGVKPGAYVMLAVGDTGHGMDRETQARVFEPFFTTKTQGKGTGLGLATTYGIVQQGGGHIWVYSEPGQGTTFKILFPRVEADPERGAVAQDATRLVGAGTVLVVEDEAIVRDYTVRVLRRAGYEVIVAEDGDEALRRLDEEHLAIDTLVTDVVMPGMSGPDLAVKVRERTPAVGIVLLSGYTAERLDLQAVLERGATFLGKPYSPAQLISAIASASGLAKERA